MLNVNTIRPVARVMIVVLYSLIFMCFSDVTKLFMFGANHVHVLLIILTDLQIWGFGLTAIYYATPWQACLLRIFGLTAIYTVHASAMQA